MGIRLYAAQTPGLRHCATSDFKEITLPGRTRQLSTKLNRKHGRNNRGVITSRHRGGGHKRVYRMVDTKRSYRGIPATVLGIAYDPNRGARLALVEYPDGKKSLYSSSTRCSTRSDNCSWSKCTTRTRKCSSN